MKKAKRGAVPVSPSRGGNLEQRVRQSERGEDITHLLLREAQVFRNERRRLGYTDSVDIGDHGQSDGENDYQISDARRGLGRNTGCHG